MENTTVILKKIKMLGDASKFSWQEAFSSKDGKTSITSILAAVVTIPSMFILTVASIGAIFGLANALVVGPWALGSLGLGAAMVGVNKVMGGKPIMEDVLPETPDQVDNEAK